jgi:hypothetical protein
MLQTMYAMNYSVNKSVFFREMSSISLRLRLYNNAVPIAGPPMTGARSLGGMKSMPFQGESNGPRLFGSASDERLGSTFLNQVSILIENFSVPGNDAPPSVGLAL